MADVKEQKPLEKNSGKYTASVSGVQYLLTFFILGSAWIVAFFSRLFAVVRFESIIHEFDPWLVYNMFIFI